MQVRIVEKGGVPVRPDAFFTTGKLLPGVVMDVPDDEGQRFVDLGFCEVIGGNSGLGNELDRGVGANPDSGKKARGRPKTKRSAIPENESGFIESRAQHEGAERDSS